MCRRFGKGKALRSGGKPDLRCLAPLVFLALECRVVAAGDPVTRLWFLNVFLKWTLNELEFLLGEAYNGKD